MMLALVKYNVLARMKPRRWGVLFLFFTGLLILYCQDIRYIGPPPQRAINVWDVAPCVLFDSFLPSFILLLGLVMLAGDDLISGRADGTLRTTLLCSRSPLRFWLARVLAWGALTGVYMTVFLLATVVTSAVSSVPLELRSSAASAESYRMFTKWYLLAPGWPTPLYTIGLVYYTAAVLWVLFTGYMALTLFVYPSLFASYVGFFLLYGMSIWITGSDTLLSVSYFLSPAKHFQLGHRAMPLWHFGGILAGMLSAFVGVGYLRLRRLEP
jgi:hypothetical protein